MVDVIRNNQQDLIGAARPSIADPFLPRKIEEGRIEDLRECIGCNICVARFAQAVPIACTQNPTLGEEYRRGWHPEHVPGARNANSPVLVVGAGPAGLECAMTLGKRGFEHVHVVDANAHVGGALRSIARLPGLAAWARVIDYRVAQIAKLPNVELVPNTELDIATLLDYGGEIVIVATGSTWASNGLNWAIHDVTPGADSSLPHVFTPEQILTGDKPLRGSRAVVYDCDGYFTGVSLAERLRLAGMEVEIVTPFASVAPYMEHTYEANLMAQRLESIGVRQSVAVVVDEITPDGVATSRVVKRDGRQLRAADSVVLVTQRLSNDRIYRELEANPQALSDAGIRALYRIGDCVVPRLIADAVFDGHRLAREIDSPDPAKPAAFIRETRVLVDHSERRSRGLGELQRAGATVLS
jgi:dimethylamine/trimethylamine dehydrogenase